MIFTIFDIFALAFVVVALAYVLILAPRSRKPTPINLAFLIVMAIMLAWQLFGRRLPEPLYAAGTIVVGLAVMTASTLVLVEWWKSIRSNG